ncbi:hypothetical protein NDU88_008457 [Pleurodeles waltl]|uniref:Receptor ligand binding region domain-containing protein n=1 Tax=Pleurodeles waltl TaxID=8319 RepID=A0AAV7P3P5_PLEWA|nr:hypothetical protein NDU88_008457 [Pleurodeles waltl]
MKHFGWTWIAVLTSDVEVCVQAGRDLKKSIEKNGGCVAFMDKIHLSYSTEKIRSLVETLQEYKVKVIIIHSSEVHTKMFLETLASQNVSDKVLVFSESFTLTPSLFRKEAWRIFNGSIALSPRAKDMPGFEQHLHRLHPSRAPAGRGLNFAVVFCGPWKRGAQSYSGCGRPPARDACRNPMGLSFPILALLDGILTALLLGRSLDGGPRAWTTPWLPSSASCGGRGVPEQAFFQSPLLEAKSSALS